MEARNWERSISHSLENSIGLKGVREDDDISLDIFQERKRTIRLKRTKYKISTGDKFSLDFTTAHIIFPFFEKENAEFELILVPHTKSTSLDDKSRYLMRSLGKLPFRLNGVQCFEAFLERGDVVDIGFNRMHFLRPKSVFKLNQEQHAIPIEILKSSLNVMIEGETGSGKTTLAKTIHDESERSGRFIHLNLSSFAPSLIESELFGHVKGAFTGAINEKRGAILEAHKGTLFLDEIDSLTLELQTKLLLFLDNFEVRAVGGNTFQKADVRLIFASGTKLKTLIELQKMRKDFYYRLISGVVISLSALRDQKEKIEDICTEFEKDNAVVLSDELLKYYKDCPWPGNIRQLVSHLKKKKILSSGKKLVLDETDHDLLFEKTVSLDQEAQQFKPLEQVKRDYCYSIYIKAEKNIMKASRLLDISPNTLKSLLADKRENLSGGNKVIDVNF